jgi:hypothetical protein
LTNRLHGDRRSERENTRGGARSRTGWAGEVVGTGTDLLILLESEEETEKGEERKKKQKKERTRVRHKDKGTEGREYNIKRETKRR